MLVQSCFCLSVALSISLTPKSRSWKALFQHNDICWHLKLWWDKLFLMVEVWETSKSSVARKFGYDADANVDGNYFLGNFFVPLYLSPTYLQALEMENDDVIEVYQEQTGGAFWSNVLSSVIAYLCFAAIFWFTFTIVTHLVLANLPNP